MRFYFVTICLLISLWPDISRAEPYSPNLYGPLGLNIVPSARMDKQGTISGGISTLDPYLHSYVGVQLADPLYVGVRQTAEISNLNEEADRFYPGLDLKIRLAEENRSRPAMALGLQSALGHKRMAGEYLALSKRYKDFDFTGGMAWGRLGSAGHIDNPLGKISRHFEQSRKLDGEDPNAPHDWFTGKKAGLFAGIEYFTPWQGLSLKADWGADRFRAENEALNYETPAPWAVGLSYSPASWANLSVAAHGTDKIMARLSLKGQLAKWRDSAKRAYKDPLPLRLHRTTLTSPALMTREAAAEDIVLYDTNVDQYQARSKILLRPSLPTPLQMGRAAVHMANHAGSHIEELTLIPTVMGLQGPSVSIMRRDLERALIDKEGSADELWRNARFNEQKGQNLAKLRRSTELFYGIKDIRLTLKNEMSLSEEDSGTLYRSSLIAKRRNPTAFGFLDSGFGLRLNLKDNLDRIRDLRPAAILPVRSDVDQFAQHRVSVDHSYIALTHSFRTDLHLSLIGGYLEEMYAGLGGEVLYHPFNKRWAVGAETWQAFKRSPLTEMNMGLNGDHLLTGHVQGWYDIPKYDLRLGARFGRYLAEDVGGTLSLAKHFKNGAKLEGFVTVTDNADYDLFGDTTHAYHGIRLSLPLGGFKYAPRNAHVAFEAHPFGRDTGQALDNPLPLYELTEPFSMPHITQHWDRVTD